jgi:hypothetical protein
MGEHRAASTEHARRHRVPARETPRKAAAGEEIQVTVRQVQTSLHGQNLIACGIHPEPSEERVSLRRDYHPGFGGVTLLRDDQHVWGAVRWRDSRSLGWIERTHVTDDEATWRLRVDGPMVSYTLVRRKHGFWVVESSEDGFA